MCSMYMHQKLPHLGYRHTFDGDVSISICIKYLRQTVRSWRYPYALSKLVSVPTFKLRKMDLKTKPIL